MHLEEITEDLVRSQMPDAGSLHTHQNTKHLTPNIHQEGKYYCPMFCEGDKVYDSNVGCPVCGMDLVKIPEKKAIEYTCPMHPEIVQNEPGNCPICGMDLVPKPSRDKMIWYSADGPMRIHETPKLTKAEKKAIKKTKYKGELP